MVQLESASGVLDADYSILVVRELNGGVIRGPVLAPNSLVSFVAPAADSLSIHTTVEYGPVIVYVARLDSAPAPCEEGAEHVEVSLQSETGLTVAELLGGADIPIPDSAGPVRVRIQARGRDLNRPTSHTGDPSEHYSIEVWPDTAPDRRHVINVAPRPRGGPYMRLSQPPWMLADPSAPARQLTPGSGNRPLSGRTAELSVSITVRATQRHTFSPLSAFWQFLERESESSGTDEGDWQVLHPSNRPHAADDGLTPEGGLVHLVYEKIQDPRLCVITWNWLVTDPSGQQQATALPGPTQLILRVESRGRSSSLVTLTHSTVPEEWAEWLRAYWTWRLQRARPWLEG